MKLVMIILVAILFFLQYRLWFCYDGLPYVLRLHRTFEIQQYDHAIFEERNHILAAEVQNSKSRLNSLEERARGELGMIKLCF